MAGKECLSIVPQNTVGMADIGRCDAILILGFLFCGEKILSVPMGLCENIFSFKIPEVKTSG
jgi:hypothetical protein